MLVAIAENNCSWLGYEQMSMGIYNNPDSKVHGANMGPIWGRQDPGGPHGGPMNFVIWECLTFQRSTEWLYSAPLGFIM